MTHWFAMTPEQRIAAVESLGLPAYRAGQVARHVFERHEFDPLQYSDLPAGLRGDLLERFFPPLLMPAREQTTDAGRTVKSAWRLEDGAVIESVLMRYPRRDTLCVSSQAGCGMGCPFCATGQGGLQRNLRLEEIVAQVADACARLGRTTPPGRVDHVVFMGMGEPMANYGPVLAAIRALIAGPPNGWGLSARGVTVSTVGLVPGIERLTREGLPLTLAVSLHAPDDDLRDELVPVNRRYPVAEVLDAAWGYAKVTRRRVSIEYALMRDVNDQVRRATALARELHRRGDWAWAHVNVIPLNPTPGRLTASRPGTQAAFVAALERAHVPVTVRDTRGRDIDGACGQLSAAVKSDANPL